MTRAGRVTADGETFADPPRLLTARQLAGLAGLVGGPEEAPDAAVDRLLRLAAELTGADGALITRIDHAQGTAEVLAAIGAVPAARGEQIPLADQLHAAVVDEDAAVLVPEAAAVPTGDAEGDGAVAGATVAAPMRRSTGRTFGLLACVSGRPRAFAPAAVDLVALLAVVAAPLALRLEAQRGETPPTTTERALGRFRTMVEHASDLLAEVDPTGRLRYANPAFCDLLGLAPDDAGAASLLDLIHPDDAQGWAMALARMGATPGPPQTLRGRLRRDDGGWRLIEATASNQVHTAGVHAVVLAAHDVTDRAATADALAAERDLLDGILDAIPHPVFLKNADGGLRRVNRAAASLWGLSDPAAVVGRRIEELLPGELGAAAAADDAEVFATGRRIEARLHRFDHAGERRWFLHDKTPLHDATGAVVGLVAIWRDVTALKTAEEAHAAERDLLQAVMAAIPDPLFVKDRAGRLIHANPAWLAENGFAEEAEVLGKDAADLLGRDYAARYAGNETAILAGGGPVLNAHEVWEEGGVATHYLMSKAVWRNAAGEPMGIVGAYRDVTALHEAAGGESTGDRR